MNTNCTGRSAEDVAQLHDHFITRTVGDLDSERGSGGEGAWRRQARTFRRGAFSVEAALAEHAGNLRDLGLGERDDAVYEDGVLFNI